MGSQVENKQSNNSDDLVDDIFSYPKLVTPELKKEFKPWHKPRKQWLRLNQWKAEIRELVKALDLVDRPLKYISLPGDDFLDIRVIYDLCEQTQLKLRFLGFNETWDEAQFNADPAYNEISSLEYIDNRSRLVPDSFESIFSTSGHDTVAGIRVKELGPFDILNLDLCDSLASPRKQRSGRTYYDALATLMHNQVANRSEPWLLFLTSRCAHDNVAQADLSKFCDGIRLNIDSSQSFAEEFIKLNSGKTLEELIDSIPNIEPLHFTNIFGIGLGKWLLQFMLGGSPKWKVSLLPSYHYKIVRKYDMLSVAFRFDRITIYPHDAIGLSKVSAASSNDANEYQLAQSLVRTFSDIKDVDQILNNDTSIKLEMVESTKKLLKQAGYDVNEYKF